MRRKTNLPAVRMDNKEKIIVQYIVGRLESVYRNENGKPVYGRNMDQVMKDLFGIKKFCKTLQRARYNESIMISLMKRLDTNTLWQIVRSNEHYKMLSYMVAMDHHIVRLGQKYNKLSDLEPVNRPSSKMRKLQKEIKKCRKMYKSCIHTMQEIFDIDKATSVDSGSSLREVMGDWLDKHDGGFDNDDIFFDIGSDYGLSSVESMDAFVARRTGKRRPNAPAAGQITGALGIFDDAGDLDDDFEDEDDVLGYGDMSDVRQMLSSMGQYGRPAPAPQPQPMVAPQQTSGGLTPELMAILTTIQAGFNQLNSTMLDVVDALPIPEGDDDPAEGYGMPLHSATDTPGRPLAGELSADEAFELSQNPPQGNLPPNVDGGNPT